MRHDFFLFLALAIGACSFDRAGAAEIRVLAGSAVQPVMSRIIPKFEAETGHHVRFDYGTVGGMAQRVQQGERADLAIVSAPQMDSLEREGRIAAGSRLALGKTGVGVFVRKAASKPDIASVDSFKRTMLAAKSIGYNDPAAGAPVGIYLLGLFERMGIAEAMAAKTVVFKQRSERFDAVARGDVEIGFNQVSEIVAVPSVDLVGPLPEAIQSYTVLTIGAVAASGQPDAARALIAFLAAPVSLAAFRSAGFVAP
jgi:molybdate transport system substrate-binding protein